MTDISLTKITDIQEKLDKITKEISALVKKITTDATGKTIVTNYSTYIIKIGTPPYYNIKIPESKGEKAFIVSMPIAKNNTKTLLPLRDLYNKIKEFKQLEKTLKKFELNKEINSSLKLTDIDLIESDEHKQKYLKYKKKYINLKNQL